MVTTRSKSPGSSVGGDSAKKKTRRRRGKRTHRKDGSTGSPAASDIDLSADGEDLMQAKRRRRYGTFFFEISIRTFVILRPLSVYN